MRGMGYRVWGKASAFPYPILPITLLAFALRLCLLTTHPLREDEAIYGYWALHFLHEDRWFLSVWPDKPPIFLWLLAATFSLLGESAASGRFLNIVISTLTVPIVAASARHLWDDRAGWISALALALNPFALSFAPTLFTDPLLVFAGSLALHMAITRRAFWAGLWLAVAIMSKQQGVLYAPLVLGVLALALWQDKKTRLRHALNQTGQGEGETGRRVEKEITDHGSRTTHDALRTLVGFLLIAAPILLWDSLRWTVAPSPWDWSVRNYAPLRLVPVGEWLQRAQQWGQQLWYLTASWPMWGVALALILWRGIEAWRTGWKQINISLFRQPETKDRPAPTTHPTPRTTHLVTLWSLAFIVLHIITTLQVWDRYLLPLAPMVALGIANCELQIRRSRSRFLNLPSPIAKLLLPLLLLILLALPAWSAAGGQLPIGADHGAYAGLDEAITWIENQIALPNPTHFALRTTDHTIRNSQLATRNSRAILYHHTLGWHFRFYLYEPVANGTLDLRWFPSSVYLTDNASKAPHLRKFLIEPHWSATPDLAFHLRSRGLHLKIHPGVGNFTLFEIVQAPQPSCDWCFSGARSPFPVLTLPDTSLMFTSPMFSSPILMFCTK